MTWPPEMRHQIIVTTDEPPPEGRAPAGHEGIILFALAAMQFIGLVDFMIVMPLGPELIADLAIDTQRFSWIVSAYTIVAGLAGFLAAPWLDRVPRRTAYLVFAIGILYIGLPLMYHYKSPWIAGSIMGIVIYGIFDLTNRAIWSEKYPYWLVMGDIIWGCLVISIVLYLIHTVI